MRYNAILVLLLISSKYHYHCNKIVWITHVKLLDHINMAKAIVCLLFLDRNYRNVTFAKEKWAFSYYFDLS